MTWLSVSEEKSEDPEENPRKSAEVSDEKSEESSSTSATTFFLSPGSAMFFLIYSYLGLA